MLQISSSLLIRALTALMATTVMVLPSVGNQARTQSPLLGVRQTLETALNKAVLEDHPHYSVQHIIETAMLLELKPAVLTDRAIDTLGRRDLPLSDESFYAQLAALVAPYDTYLRDRCLRLAVAEGQAALDDKKRWIADLPPAPGVSPFGDPEQLKKQGRQLLAFRFELWQSVAMATNQPFGAGARLQKLFAAPEINQITGSCVPTPYRHHIARELARLDPDLLLSTAPLSLSQKELTGICSWEANERVRRGLVDESVKTLITYAVKNGELTRITLNIYALFDLEDAWRLAQIMPVENMRGTVLNDLMVTWAWQDLDKAQAIAEAETDKMAKGTYRHIVARIWTFKRPESIKRVLTESARTSPTPEQKVLLDMAAQELAYRKAGNEPRDTREKAGDAGGMAVLIDPLSRSSKSRRALEMLEQIKKKYQL